MGYDDQQGLIACMFERPELVSLDYSGTLSQQLLYCGDDVLHRENNIIVNKAAGNTSQCFVHGNGDTMKAWWPKLFPDCADSGDYGKDFVT